MSARMHDVVVVGMGPVGLIVANLLGGAGLDVAVFDRAAGLSTLPRAIAYDDETLRVLASAGLLEAIEPVLITNLKARFLNARGGVLMEVEPHDTVHGHSALGTFHQPSFEAVMLDGLDRFERVTTHFEREVLRYDQRPGFVELAVRAKGDADAMPVRARFVVACDGGNSLARTTIGSKLVGSSATERWLVVDAVVPDHDVDSIRFYCDPDRPTVQVPAIGDRVRWEFLQAAGESDEFLLDGGTVRSLVKRHIDSPAMTLERTALYTFRSLVANRWSQGRIFLAGDAAHMMPPFAGQGMNSGFKDASNLVWKIVAVLRHGAPFALLASYEEERRAPAIRIVQFSGVLGHVIMARKKSIAAVRDRLFAFLNSIPAVKRHIRKGGLRSIPNIAKSAFFAACKGKPAHSMMPQPSVLTDDGTKLLDRVTPDGRWVLFGFETDPRATLPDSELKLLERLEVAFVRIESGEHAPRSPDVVTVTDPGFVRWMHKLGCPGVLVRPDRFIAHAVTKDGPLTALHALAPLATV